MKSGRRQRPELLPRPFESYLFLVRVAVVLLDVLNVVVEVAPVMAGPELVVVHHVQELVRLLEVPLRVPREVRGGPEQRPRPPRVTAAAAGGGEKVVSLLLLLLFLRIEIGGARLPVLLLVQRSPAPRERHLCGSANQSISVTCFFANCYCGNTGKWNFPENGAEFTD